MNEGVRQSLLLEARRVSLGPAIGNADDVDRAARVPTESIDALRQAGLLAFFIPIDLGGPEGDVRTFASIAARLAAGCTSTAFIWVMHCVQVAVLARHHVSSPHVLEDVLKSGSLVASATSDRATRMPGEATSPLNWHGATATVDRMAPAVSYGEMAQYALCSFAETAEPGSDLPATTRLLVLERGPIDFTATGGWDGLGLRGTGTVPMVFKGSVSRESAVAAPMSEVLRTTMLPLAHIGWAAVWFGAVRGALDRTLLSPSGRRALERSPAGTVGGMVANLEALRSAIECAVAHEEAGDGVASRLDVRRAVALNSLKVSGSSIAAAVARRLLEAAGMSLGYSRGGLGIERVVRDVMSGPLMIANDVLREHIESLVLADRTALDFW